MKGVILAAGKGRRLYPITKGIPKALLPVYDRPMIYYAMDFMKEAGVREVAIVVSEEQKNIFESALGDGAEFGCDITYYIQRIANGTAGAMIDVKDFIEGEDVLLYYGDNVLLGDETARLVREGRDNAQKGMASVLALAVANPIDYGVLELDSDGSVLSIEEKPSKPKSNFIAPGIYFYPADVTFKLERVTKSPRGEYEMTEVNEMYLREGNLRATKLDSETFWFDAGSFDALLDASNTIRDHRKRS